VTTRHGPRSPTTDAPEHVRAAKMELRRLGEIEREVRKRWYAAKAKARADDFPDVFAIGQAAIELWAAEEARELAAARWRTILDERKALPADQRWDQADLERWAASSAGVV
jgi:hypothetical protein